MNTLKSSCNTKKSLGNLLHEDISLPLMTLKHSALLQNCRWMQEYANNAQVKLAPHGKTSMCPALFELQLQQGAWGMTLANSFQVQIAYQQGIKKILMANQLVGKQNISDILKVLKADNDFEFYCLVDNRDNIDQLNDVCTKFDQGLKVLIEIAPTHGRAGLRNKAAIIDLAQYIKSSASMIELVGIECYEGVIHCDNPIPVVNQFLEFVSNTTVELETLGLFETEKTMLSGGGTVFFDRVCDILSKTPLKNSFELLIRPGCYISHDSGIYDEFQDQLLERDSLARAIPNSLETAIEIYTYIQSIPEPGLAILNIGKRDVSFDSGLPNPAQLYRTQDANLSSLDKHWEIIDLNDQHAFLSFPVEQSISVGDILICQVSHPCLTFDKWSTIGLIDDQHNVIKFIETKFNRHSSES